MPMKGVGLPSFWKRYLGIPAGFAGIIALYLITMFGILAYTIFTFQSQRSAAVAMDLAGRQRMLNTKHMMQMILVSQGVRVKPTSILFSTDGCSNRLLHAELKGNHMHVEGRRTLLVHTGRETSGVRCSMELPPPQGRV